MSEQALDIARKLVARDAETPEWRRRIEVGRGGLMLLATTLIELDEQLRSAEKERDEWVTRYHQLAVTSNRASGVRGRPSSGSLDGND